MHGRMEDSYIAATARRYGLTIVTGNDQDFRRPRTSIVFPQEHVAEAQSTKVENLEPRLDYTPDLSLPVSSWSDPHRS